MKFVTLATNSTGYFKTMIASANNNNIDVDVLGMGEKWYGYSMKINKLNDYIKNLKDDEIVCFFDAYDVIFCDNSKNIEEKYINSKKDILIGCHEKPGIIINHFMKSIYNYNEKNKTNSKYKYLCSGTIIGRVKYIKNILNIFNNNYVDDQVFWYDMYLKNENIFMDHNNDMFYTCCPPKNIYNFINNKADYSDLKIQNNKVTNTYTNTSPSMIHFPGDSDMKNVIKELNLKIVDDPEHHKRLVKKTETYASNFSFNQIILPLVILIFLVILLYKKYFLMFIFFIILLLFI